jgi:hypothetical protein
MTVDAVIAANAPYWGAEAEICRTYFRSPTRTAATDAAWLARQAAKELLDGVVPRLRALDAALASGAVNPAPLAVVAEELHEEAVHFAAFVAAYERVRPAGAPALDRHELESAVAWPGNVALGALRAAHLARDEHLGAVAGSVTEGGGCAVFHEGVALAGGTDADEAIAEACATVLADEAAHMLVGLEEAGRAGLTAEEWSIVVTMSVAQSRARLVMRDQQFGGVVGAARLGELIESGAAPLVPGAR